MHFTYFVIWKTHPAAGTSTSAVFWRIRKVHQQSRPYGLERLSEQIKIAKTLIPPFTSLHHPMDASCWRALEDCIKGTLPYFYGFDMFWGWLRGDRAKHNDEVKNVKMAHSV